MKTVTLTQESTIELADKPQPDVAPGVVLLEVELCGICGTDLHAPDIEQLFATPVVLGHEFTARVHGVGPAVDHLAIDDRIVINPVALSCGSCPACYAGYQNLCANAHATCVGMGKDGGMAPFVAVEAAHVVALPDELSAAVGAWTEPLAVAVRATRRAGLRLGDAVAVLGAGPIGQLAAQLATAAGCREVLIVEPSANRREIALACGASTAVHPDDVGAIDSLYDAVFDCTGVPSVVDSALRLVGVGGRVVVIGTFAGENPIHERMTAHAKEATLTFSVCYQLRPEFMTAMDLLGRGIVDVGPLTSRVAALEDFSGAFAEMREGGIKVLLSPSVGPRT